jgi:hypothetical protein
MGVLRVVSKSDQDLVPEVRMIVKSLREAAASRSGQWTCWIDRQGSRFAVRVDDVEDTGRGFTALATCDAVVRAFEHFVDTTPRRSEPSQRRPLTTRLSPTA